MNRHELQMKSRRGSVLLVAEGDSWFDFPYPCRTDIVKQMQHLGYAVSEVADSTHTLEFMATKEHQKHEFEDVVNKLAKRKTRPTAVLLSGGGNDFIDRLPLLLNEYDPKIPTLDEKEVNDFVENHIRKFYEEWLKFVTDTCDKAFENIERIPIIIHGYAYVVPDGRGLPLYKENWLKKEFRAKGHRDLAQNTKTMATLINMFNDVLSALAGNRSFDHVHYVNLRDTLSNDLSRMNGKRRYKEDWGDELHPTNEGFARVAAELSRVIDGFWAVDS